MLLEHLESLDLPKHIHLKVLRGRDVVSGEELAYPVLWADRPYDRCTSCGQGISSVVDECPIALNEGAGQGGALLEYSQQHGCGEWLSVQSARFRDGEGDPETILDVAAKMADDRKQHIAAARRVVEAQVHRELYVAQQALLTPLEDGETVDERLDAVCTGSEVEPGVYVDRGYLAAWDYPPINDDSDPIVEESASPLVFTVQVQALSDDGRSWEPLMSAPAIGEDARSVALHCALNQTVADPDSHEWRVAVWAGGTYGPETYTITAEQVPVEVDKLRLVDIRLQIAELEKERDMLSAKLLAARAVSRRGLGRLTGVSHPTVSSRAQRAADQDGTEVS